MLITLILLTITLIYFFKLVVLLYADDTIVFSNTEVRLISIMQNANYCDTWKLNTNYIKTKVVVFGDRQCRHRYITMYDTRIEVVDTFKFLGVMFSKNRQFTLAKRLSVDQAKKAMFSVYKKIRNLDLPID